MFELQWMMNAKSLKKLLVIKRNMVLAATLFDMLLVYDWPFLHVHNLQES